MSRSVPGSMLTWLYADSSEPSRIEHSRYCYRADGMRRQYFSEAEKIGALATMFSMIFFFTIPTDDLGDCEEVTSELMRDFVYLSYLGSWLCC